MIVALVVPTIMKVGIVIDFKINQDFIAAELCINKEKPVLKCNGKCYLSKQLKETEDKEEKQAPRSQKNKAEIVYYFAKNTWISEELTPIFITKMKSVATNDLLIDSYTSSIFHPPQFC